LLSLGPEDPAVDPDPALTAEAVLLSLGPAAGCVPTAAATLLSEGPLALCAAGCAVAEPAAEPLSEVELPSLSAITSTTAAAAASVSSAASHTARRDMCIAGSDM
jgi:hypothetical protein